MNLLLIAEHDGQKLNPSTARALSCAHDIKLDIHILVAGHQCESIAQEASQLSGVKQVIHVEHPELQHALASNLATLISDIAGDYSHILFPSTTFGKDIAPRTAALINTPQISDIMQVHSPREFTRPVYAGNALVNVSVPEGLTILATVRTASFKAAQNGGNAEIVKQDCNTTFPEHTRFIELASEAGERPDLQAADRVVSGGRGVGSEQNFSIIYALADKLGAAVGASRAAVDAGFVANDLQVGQTGKIIAPDLYMAIGISGAIQHLTGIKDAGTIVAINKDADAPIFEIADIGLVGDLFKIIPELTEAL